MQNYIRPATTTTLATQSSLCVYCPALFHTYYLQHAPPCPTSTLPRPVQNCPVPGMSGPTTSIPHSTSAVMAPIASRLHHLVAGTCVVPPAVTLKPISTPLNADAWAQAFCNHPDQAFVAALVDGIRHGFHIGLVPSTACRSSSQNSPSAQEHGDVVDAFIAQQLAAGFMTALSFQPTAQVFSPAI